MEKSIVVEVEGRSETGKNASRRYRRNARIPGTFYGGNEPTLSIAVDPKRIEEVLRLETGRNTIFALSMDGREQSRAVMIKELQRDPVTDKVMHVDLVRVRLDRAVTVSVPIRLIGVPEGVKSEGGVLEFIIREMEVSCLPSDIPEHLDADVSALHINQHVSVSALQVGERVKLLAEPETIVAVVVPPKAEEVAAPAAEEAPAEAAEPEVIKKGKEAAAPEAEPPAKEKGSKERDKDKEKEK